MTEKAIAVGSCSLCQVIDEGFDRFAAGVSKDWRSAIVGGIGLHEGRIELVLADQQAEAIAKARLTVVVAIGSVRRRRTMMGSVRIRRPRRPPSSSTEQRPMP